MSESAKNPQNLSDVGSPVSLELLEEYTGGDREFLIELTDQFWLDLDERLPLLKAAAAPFQPAVMKSAAHAIAGSATCVGAEMLREKCLAIEECARGTDATRIPTLLREFEVEVERVREFFRSYLE